MPEDAITSSNILEKIVHMTKAYKWQGIVLMDYLPLSSTNYDISLIAKTCIVYMANQAEMGLLPRMDKSKSLGSIFCVCHMKLITKVKQ